MTLWRGEFHIAAPGPQLLDSFLQLPGWRKGLVWVNGVNLGRYWPAAGPQVTLYVPGLVLRPGNNTILLMEQVRQISQHQDPTSSCVCLYV